MKLRTTRSQLLEALGSVIGVVERRQTLPILGNVLLELAEERLTITATDLEIQMQASVEVSNLKPGRITVSARKLYEICRGLPEGAELSLEVVDDRATLHSGKSRFWLATLKADEFSTFPPLKDGASIELEGATLKRLIERTQFAMAQQDVRYYLNGMLLEVRNEGLRAVATDGHRLALAEATLDTSSLQPSSVIIPRKAVLELVRMVSRAGDQRVVLRFSATQLEADFDQIRMATKLVDGRFPEYERVIPTQNDRRMTGSRDRVRQALMRTAILSNEKFRGVRLSLSPGKLVLQTHNPEHEEAEEELEVQFEGAPIEIGFNVGYLVDALSVLPDDTFYLDLRNSESSGLIQSASDASVRYVVMPMRL